MWAVYAIGAALLWGLDYTLTEKVLNRVTFSTLLTIELFFGFLGMLGLSLLTGVFWPELSAILRSKQTLLWVLVIVIVFNTANGLIVASIGAKNATIAGLIEISYPLFIAAFTWLLFGEDRLNLGTAFGAGLVVLGTLMIYYYNA